MWEDWTPLIRSQDHSDFTIDWSEEVFESGPDSGHYFILMVPEVRDSIKLPSLLPLCLSWPAGPLGSAIQQETIPRLMPGLAGPRRRHGNCSDSAPTAAGSAPRV